MQRSDSGIRCHSFTNFQYPRSDRRRCNVKSMFVTWSDILDFQYPRSDRRRCNSDRIRWQLGTDDDFQYPRSDRRRCNSVVIADRAVKEPTFSILGRIGGDATKFYSTGFTDEVSLSVSSVGSEAMQLWKASLKSTATPSFSILGRIGGDATMQVPDRMRSGGPFSILGRIGGDATSGVRGTIMASWPFSILGRIGGDATMQVPDRMRSGGPFSILGRIGGDATQHILPGSPGRHRFQYPRSDRRRCNHRLPPQVQSRVNHFQYPRSDRRRCNAAYPNERFWP